MTPKLLVAAVAAAAIAIGFVLPAHHSDAENAKSQIPTIEVGKG